MTYSKNGMPFFVACNRRYNQSEERRQVYIRIQDIILGSYKQHYPARKFCKFVNCTFVLFFSFQLGKMFFKISPAFSNGVLETKMRFITKQIIQWGRDLKGKHQNVQYIKQSCILSNIIAEQVYSRSFYCFSQGYI